MATPLSRHTDDLLVQLSAMPSDAKIGMTKYGVIVKYGGCDFRFHPQQNMRLCDFILNRELSPKRMPSAWNRFAAQLHAVFSGVKASRLLKALNSRAVQSVERFSVRSCLGGDALRTLHPSHSISPLASKSSASNDELINRAKAKLAAIRVQTALNQTAAATTNTLTQGFVRRNTHDAVTPSTASPLSSQPPARPSIGVMAPNLVPPKPSNPAPVVVHNANR